MRRGNYRTPSPREAMPAGGGVAVPTGDCHVPSAGFVEATAAYRGSTSHRNSNGHDRQLKPHAVVVLAFFALSACPYWREALAPVHRTALVQCFLVGSSERWVFS